MAKTKDDKAPAKKANSSTTKTDASNSTNKKEIAASRLNSSKYGTTEESILDVETIDAADGLAELFYNGIKGMYWSEQQLVDALPKMADAAASKELAQAILNHQAETTTHVERLEQVFEIMDMAPRTKKCMALEGLTIDGEAVIENTDTGSPARDLGIIMASQKVEHYEIAAYTGLIDLAQKLGMEEIAGVLQETLQEEQASSQLLQQVADTDESIREALATGKESYNAE